METTESEGFENFDEALSLTAKVKIWAAKLRPDYIKIDGSIIKNIDTDFSARAIVETIVNFAKKLNIKTIAEFVHSESVLYTVKEVGD